MPDKILLVVCFGGSNSTSLRLRPPAAMDHAAFHIVYVDKRVSKKLDGAYLGDEAATGQPISKNIAFQRTLSTACLDQLSSECAEVQANLSNLLASFDGGGSDDFHERLLPWHQSPSQSPRVANVGFADES